MFKLMRVARYPQGAAARLTAALAGARTQSCIRATVAQ